ncbi:hypothetical protein [Microbacterium panaciterrae]|uniref:Uncharacterized protein n=1 Tax=Microbacterium panaciterrae TaxID=985759 RepID=A0ABP8PHB7_9MICO
MSDNSADPADGLWSRLRLIEGQPLDSRAAAYSSLHDDLARRLESAPRDPATPRSGSDRG